MRKTGSKRMQKWVKDILRSEQITAEREEHLCTEHNKAELGIQIKAFEKLKRWQRRWVGESF